MSKQQKYLHQLQIWESDGIKLDTEQEVHRQVDLKV